jgi:hypothetical protein
MRRRDFVRWIAVIATSWPTAGWTQTRKTPLVGFLRSTGEPGSRYLVAAFRRGLKEAGFGDRDVIVEYRWGDDRNDQLPALAEWLCGASDRVYPTGVPRPRRGARRAAPASCAVLLHGILQRYPHPSFPGKGRPDHTRHSEHRPPPMSSCARRSASPVCASLILREGQP